MTAVVEAGIAAVFEHLKSLVEIGIDEPVWWRDWRKLIVAAGRETGAENIPDLACEDLEEWKRAIQELKDGILRGAGRQERPLPVGRHPKKATARGHTMRRPQNLWGARVDELNDRQIKARVSELREACRTAIEKG